MTVPMRSFFYGSFLLVSYVSCLPLLCCLDCSFQPCGHLLGVVFSYVLSFIQICPDPHITRGGLGAVGLFGPSSNFY